MQSLIRAQLQPKDAADILQKGIKKSKDDLDNLVHRFFDSGANHLLLLTLPDITQSSVSNNYPAEIIKIMVLLTNTLNNHIRFLAREGSDTHNVYFSDAFSLHKELIENPSLYGLTEMHDAACPGNSFLCVSSTQFVEPDADQKYFFADEVHPTSAVHRIFADLIIGNWETSAHMATISYNFAQRLRDQYQSHWDYLFHKMRVSSPGMTGNIHFNIISNTKEHSNLFFSPRLYPQEFSLGLTMHPFRMVNFNYFNGCFDLSPSIAVNHKTISAEILQSIVWNPIQLNLIAGITAINFTDVSRRLLIGLHTRTHHSHGVGQSVHMMGEVQYHQYGDMWHGIFGSRMVGQYTRLGGLNETSDQTSALHFNFSDTWDAHVLLFAEGRYHQPLEIPVEFFLRIQQEAISFFTIPDIVHIKVIKGSSNAFLPINLEKKRIKKWSPSIEWGVQGLGDYLWQVAIRVQQREKHWAMQLNTALSF